MLARGGSDEKAFSRLIEEGVLSLGGAQSGVPFEALLKSAPTDAHQQRSRRSWSEGRSACSYEFGMFLEYVSVGTKRNGVDSFYKKS